MGWETNVTTTAVLGPLVYGPEGCGDGDLIPGVAAPMNTVHGIQRCDLCQLYPDDDSAAAALATFVAGGEVRRPSSDEDLWIFVDGQPVDWTTYELDASWPSTMTCERCGQGVDRFGSGPYWHVDTMQEICANSLHRATPAEDRGPI